jgi:hypothetical protein
MVFASWNLHRPFLIQERRQADSSIIAVVVVQMQFPPYDFGWTMTLEAEHRPCNKDHCTSYYRNENREHHRCAGSHYAIAEG